MATCLGNLKSLEIACLVLLTLASYARAATPSDLDKQIDAARDNLLKMLDATDPDTRDAAYAEVKKATSAADAALADLMASSSDAHRATLSEFKGTWESFKATRDTELVPAALSGDTEKIKQAKQKAGSIQKERFLKMKQLIADLGK